MKRRLLVLLFGLSFQGQGAIVLDDTPRTIRALTPENSILFDFDQNGRSDWFIQSIFRTDGNIFQIQNFSVNQTEFLYDYSVISMYGTDHRPLAIASLIGLESETTLVRFGIPGEGNRGPLVTWLPETFNHPGQGSFVGETA